MFVDKSDGFRSLLSETAPVDSLLIFNNRNFHRKLKSEGIHSDSAHYPFLFKMNNERETIPLKYRILKGDGSSVRVLSLLHPAAQLEINNIYKTFASRILYHCDRSSASLRFPKELASKTVKSVASDSAIGFFQNHPYGRLYKFFGSSEYFEIERNFSNMWTFDISRCFDSIYTHSISWAIKGKQFAKLTTATTDFGNILDRVCQLSNNRETNGIPVGNEFSRIFAEIILQDVDARVISSLSSLSRPIHYGKDYIFKRYVDDYFFFFNEPSVASIFNSELEKTLRFYKLFLSPDKTKKIERPIITKITASQFEVSRLINDFFSRFSKASKTGLELNRMISPDKLFRWFINGLMSATEGDSSSYLVMCSYVLGAISKRVASCAGWDPAKGTSEFQVFSIYKMLVDLSFHLFAVNPNMVSSFRLSEICYRLGAKIDESLPSFRHDFSFVIGENIKSFFQQGSNSHSKLQKHDFVPIELLNILCVGKDLCSKYTLSIETVEALFKTDRLLNSSKKFLKDEESNDYFQIMAALYYCGDNLKLSGVNKVLVRCINDRITGNIKNAVSDARILYLFMDSMSCPYINDRHKRQWFSQFSSHFLSRTAGDEASIFDSLTGDDWFISWRSKDILSLIESKEVLSGYS